MKLFMHPASTTCRPILFFAADNGIELENQVVDLMKGEHYGEAFSAINPNHLVPVLQDGDLTLTESATILRYLAEKTNSALYPKDLVKRAKVNEAMDWFNTNFYREFGYHLIYPQVFPHHKRPTEDATKATVDWGKEKSLTALKILDEHFLGGGNFLVGNELTIADYFGAGLVSCGELVGVDFSQFPNVNRWFNGLKDRPAWKQITEAHYGFAESMKDQSFTTLA